MKTMILSLLGAALLGAGCASNSRTVVQQPVGPSHGNPVAGNAHGQLVVYSCWESQPFADYDYSTRSSYEILSPAGDLVQCVRNDAGGFEHNAVTVSLPTGAYQVSSFVPGLGQTTLPVRIQPGLTTKVYLDGSANRRHKDATANALVKLPNGDIAGWSADLAAGALEKAMSAE